MSFFRKSAAPEEKPAAGDATKSLAARKERELLALGEIYYESTRSGRTDVKALARKMKDLEKLDSQLDAARAPRTPSGAPAPAPPEARSKATLCGKCGAALTPTDRYCIQCGSAASNQRPLGRPCPVCNRSVDDGARFCNSCGASMSTQGRIRIRHPLTGQEASFDFQHAQGNFPAGSYEPDAVERNADYDEPAPSPGEDGDAERDWIRELERFARPAQADVHMFVNRGKEFMQSKRYREAAAEFEGAILQNARDPRAHYFLGIARYKCGDLEAAIEAFGRCIRLDRTNSDAHNDLGLCHARLGQWREALEHYNQALRLNPGHPDAHYNIAHHFMQQMAYADAIQHLQLYLQYSPRAQDFKRVTEMIDKLHAAIKSGARMGVESMLPQR